MIVGEFPHEADIAKGEPLVCKVHQSGGGLSLAPAILSLLHSLRDEAPVKFSLSTKSRNITFKGASDFGHTNLNHIALILEQISVVARRCSLHDAHCHHRNQQRVA